MTPVQVDLRERRAKRQCLGIGRLRFFEAAELLERVSAIEESGSVLRTELERPVGCSQSLLEFSQFLKCRGPIAVRFRHPGARFQRRIECLEGFARVAALEMNVPEDILADRRFYRHRIAFDSAHRVIEIAGADRRNRGLYRLTAGNVAAERPKAGWWSGCAHRTDLVGIGYSSLRSQVIGRQAHPIKNVEPAYEPKVTI